MSVDFPAVSYLHNQDQEFVVVDFVDDTVIADPDSPLSIATDELGRFGGPWSGPQYFHGLQHPDLRGFVQFADLLCRRGRVGDVEVCAHASMPSSRNNSV